MSWKLSLSHTAPFSQVTRPDPYNSSSTARTPAPRMPDGGSPRVAWVPTGWILFLETMGTSGDMALVIIISRELLFLFLYSWVLSNHQWLANRLRHRIHPCFAKILKTGERSSENFGRLWFWLEVPWWLEAKYTGSDPYVTNVTALMRIKFSFYSEPPLTS